LRRVPRWLVITAAAVAVLAAGSLWLIVSLPDRTFVEHSVDHPGSTRLIPTAPLAPRSRTNAVWSGEELLVWSGAVPGEADQHGAVGDEPFEVLADGAAYHPGEDTWRTLPTAPISGRVGAGTVWAGDRLVVWGGFSVPDRALGDGAMYLPDQDAWERLPSAPITARGDLTAVWTGREVLFVGGAERTGRFGRVSGEHRDGAAYDLETGQWRTIQPVPDGVWSVRNRGVWPIRERFTGTWSGDVLFVWGRDVALYDPAADQWQRVTAPLSGIRVGGAVEAVSLRGQVVVIGLAARDDPATFGITYQPASGTFGTVPAVTGQSMSTLRQAVAAGEHVLALLTGPEEAMRWSPGEDSWQSIPPALSRGVEAVPVWTGAELLVWGGSVGGDPRADGVAWTP
jgi:hypothetical protein